MGTPNLLTAKADISATVKNFLIAGSELRIATTEDQVIEISFLPSEWKSFIDLMQEDCE